MDGFENKRRDFIKKLGLSVGIIAASASASTAADIIQNKIQFPLSSDQQAFINKYEKWMDSFIEVIKIQRKNPDDLENNKRLMVLTDESASWQKEHFKYMEDENFARHYMIVSERMTKEII